MAFTKSSELKISMSSTCSPTPMNFTGILFSSTIPITTPPFAVPSNFVNIKPVISTVSLNAFTCYIAFCPVVASNTISTSWHASGNSLSITFLIFSNSSIKYFLL